MSELFTRSRLLIWFPIPSETFGSGVVAAVGVPAAEVPPAAAVGDAWGAGDAHAASRESALAPANHPIAVRL
jgi:hypothetical protein